MARSGDLQCALGAGLAAHIAQLERKWRSSGPRCSRRSQGLRGITGLQGGNDVEQMPRAAHIHAIGQGGFASTGVG